MEELEKAKQGQDDIAGMIKEQAETDYSDAELLKELEDMEEK